MVSIVRCLILSFFAFLPLTVRAAQPVTTPALAEKMSVDVASTSVFKVNAVIKAFEKVFGTNSIQANKYRTASHISEQPVGELSGIEGAINRLNGLPADSKAQWAVSIESYIQYFPDKGSWYDIGCIVLLDRQKSNKVIFFTKPTFIPSEYVEKAKKESSEVNATGYSVTAGEMINRQFPNIPKDNWHADTMFGGISRDVLLQDAIYSALRGITCL